MKRPILALLMLFALLPFGRGAFSQPYTQTSAATAVPWGRSSRTQFAFSDGVFFSAYDNGTNAVFRLSADGQTWTSEVTISGTSGLARPLNIGLCKGTGNVLYGVVAGTASFVPVKFTYAGGGAVNTNITAVTGVSQTVSVGTSSTFGPSAFAVFDSTNSLFHVGIGGHNGFDEMRLYAYPVALTSATGALYSYVGSGLASDTSYVNAMVCQGGVLYVVGSNKGTIVTTNGTSSYTVGTVTTGIWNASSEQLDNGVAGTIDAGNSNYPTFVCSTGNTSKTKIVYYNTTSTTWVSAELTSGGASIISTGANVVAVGNDLWVYYTLTSSSVVYRIKRVSGMWEANATAISATDAAGYTRANVADVQNSGNVLVSWISGTASPYTVLDNTYSGVSPPTDFTFTLSPTTVAATGATTGTVTFNNPLTASETLTLSATNTGTGTGVFSPVSPIVVASGQTSQTFTYTTAAGSAGTHTLTVAGTGNFSASHTASLTVTNGYAPGTLSQGTVVYNSVGLTWTLPSNSTGTVTQNVQRSIASDTTFTGTITTVNGGTPLNGAATSISDTGVAPATTYNYRVQQIDSVNGTVYTNIIQVTTPAAPGIAAQDNLQGGTVGGPINGRVASGGTYTWAYGTFHPASFSQSADGWVYGTASYSGGPTFASLTPALGTADYHASFLFRDLTQQINGPTAYFCTRWQTNETGYLLAYSKSAWTLYRYATAGSGGTALATVAYTTYPGDSGLVDISTSGATLTCTYKGVNLFTGITGTNGATITAGVITDSTPVSQNGNIGCGFSGAGASLINGLHIGYVTAWTGGSFPTTATAWQFIGQTTGYGKVLTDKIAVALSPVQATVSGNVTVNLTDGSTGTYYAGWPPVPVTSVTLSTGSPIAYVYYRNPSTNPGNITLTGTNNGALTNASQGLALTTDTVFRVSVIGDSISWSQGARFQTPNEEAMRFLENYQNGPQGGQVYYTWAVNQGPTNDGKTHAGYNGTSTGSWLGYTTGASVSLLYDMVQVASLYNAHNYDIDLGTNDAGITQATYQSNLQTICTNILANDTSAKIQIDGEGYRNTGNDSYIVQYQTAIANVVALFPGQVFAGDLNDYHNLSLLNWNQYGAGGASSWYSASNNVHPSAAGDTVAGTIKGAWFYNNFLAPAPTGGGTSTGRRRLY